MQPSILAIETATDACSVAIKTPSARSERCIIQPQAHAKLVLGMIDEVCQEVGIPLAEIDAIAFGRGPGSFTGVRIAASVVQGLALGLKKPVIAVSSLQALAQQAVNTKNAEQVLALLDARMQEVYWGIYVAGADGLVEAATTEMVQNPTHLNIGSKFTGLTVGTGAIAYKQLLLAINPELCIDETIQYPLANEVLQLATKKYLAGETMPGYNALPTYIRNDVAQKSKKNPD